MRPFEHLRGSPKHHLFEKENHLNQASFLGSNWIFWGVFETWAGFSGFPRQEIKSGGCLEPLMFGIHVRCSGHVCIYKYIHMYSIEWRRFLRYFRVVRWISEMLVQWPIWFSGNLGLEKKSTSDLLHETDFILLTCTPRKTNGWNLKMNPWSPGDSCIFLLETHHFQVPAVSFFGGYYFMQFLLVDTT